MSGTVEFRLLGPLEAVVGGRRVQVNGRRQRELLAALLVSANRHVSVDALVEVAWPGGSPASARRQVQNSVGRLRQVLVVGGMASDVIETRPGGYVLRVAEEELDALVFTSRAAEGRRAAREGRLEVAAAKLRSALALWRGPVLAEFDVETISGAAARLEEQRLAVLEDCLELELRQGLQHRLVDELTALARQHPLRERPWTLLMLALYRDGRRADALAAYQRARRGFVAELGLEPGPELAELQAAILSQDPALDLPDGELARPCQLLPDIPDFIGREELVAELESRFRRRCRAVSIATIAGRAGVGKTALAVHVAHRLREVFRDGQLYVNLGGAGEHRADPSEVLARFLRALGVPGRAVPPGLEERAVMYRERLADRRVLVLLDNAVDDAQVRPLLPGVAGSAVLITGRSRLSGLPGARLVELDVLPADEAVRLMARIVGDRRVSSQQDVAAELVRLCGRLPLALRIVGARLAVRPHWTLERMACRLQDERRRLDELTYGDLEVRAGLAMSYRHLEPRARLLFHLLGLLDVPDVAGWVCAALLDTTLPDAEELADTLIDAQLVDPAGRDAAGQLRYRLHDLVRLYAREQAAQEPAAAGAAALTRALGAWLALVERAHRAVYGGDFAILHGSAPRWPAAVDELAAVIDADPLTWYETERLNIVASIRQATDLVLETSSALPAELAWDLSASTVSLFLIRGHYDEWDEVLTRSLTAARTAGDRRGTAVTLTGLAWLATYRHRYQGAEELVAEALDIFRELGDDHGLALALPMAIHVDGLRGRYDNAVIRYEEVLTVLRMVGDRAAEIFVLRSLGQVLVEAGLPKQARPYLEQALAQSHKGSPRARAEVLCWLGESHLHQGDLDQAERMFREMLIITVATADLRGQANARHGLGRIKLTTGALTEALELLQHALLLSMQLGERRLEARIRLALGHLHHHRDDSVQAIRQLTQSARTFKDIGAALWHQRALTALDEVRDRPDRVLPS